VLRIACLGYIHQTDRSRTTDMTRYERPSYVVVARRDGYEVRRYDSYLAAETTVFGSYESTGNLAFRRLAGFIFGRNSQGKKMKMTVPVTHEPMENGGHRYRFVMERAFTEDDLPQPVDDTVAVVRVPAVHYAALPYRGGRDERRFRFAEAKLLAGLQQDGVPNVGPATNAVYDGPYVPGPLRRNEVLIPVAGPEQTPGNALP
jgi:hypothetical protein